MAGKSGSEAYAGVNRGRQARSRTRAQQRTPRRAISQQEAGTPF